MLSGLLDILRGAWHWIRSKIRNALDWIADLLNRLRQQVSLDGQTSEDAAGTAPSAASLPEPAEAKPASAAAPEGQPLQTGHSLPSAILATAARMPPLLSRLGRTRQHASDGPPSTSPTAASNSKDAQTLADPLDAPADDVALARMLASEPRFQSARELIGWLTIQRARARKLSVYQLLTQGKGYGPQDRGERGGGSMFASTARRPGAADMQLARALLSGEVQPSEAIRQRKPGRWIERGQGLSDAEILARQTRWGEGIYARVQGTRWLLLSPSISPLLTGARHSASEILDLVPDVPPLDREYSLKSEILGQIVA